MAPKLAKSLSGVDFCGYNVTYDLRIIRAEMKRAGVAWDYESACVIDALRIFQILHPRDLESAYKPEETRYAYIIRVKRCKSALWQFLACS